ncbi:hypothetical protein Ddye_025362 [Dipteronia dyeriana]|uniref:Uncharacterized protein n=1 Tax=Dipteronia dyeriana TaxID=168575 RepID=A0AAD9TWK6_9ROSI|nr:hypothetical protein Ddye_025362 [Dipteronia dyeriana]
MNFNIGGSSNLLGSSSSSDEEEREILANLDAIDAEEEEMLAQHGQFQQAVAQYLNRQNNPVTRGGSIPGHIVINRDRESPDRLFRMLAYGCPSDATDEYIKIGESTTIEILLCYCGGIYNMHNMIIADERDIDASIKDRMEAPTPEVEMVLDENTRFQ